MATARLFSALLMAALSMCVSKAVGAASGDPALTLLHEGGERTYTASKLLSRSDIEEVTIADVGAYPRQQMTFRAVKVARLLQGLSIDADATVEFVALDGFAATFQPAVLLNTSAEAAIAYLAVEDPAMKWPLRANGQSSAGPFYLFWIDPELSDIGREEWPFMIERIEIKSSLEALYPKIFPAKDVLEGAAIRKGLAVYVKNCLSCHTLNGEGPGRVGPDLNAPMSPLDYFEKGIFRRFVRDPQSVRYNPNTAMAAFGPEILSDEDLDNLVAYLKHMSNTRRAASGDFR